MGVQNFNFTPKFSQNVGFSLKFCIFEQKVVHDQIFGQFF